MRERERESLMELKTQRRSWMSAETDTMTFYFVLNVR